LTIRRLDRCCPFRILAFGSFANSAHFPWRPLAVRHLFGDLPDAIDVNPLACVRQYKGAHRDARADLAVCREFNDLIVSTLVAD
jgi:hypothetical protein